MLYLLAKLYGWAVEIRLHFYRKGWLSRQRLGRPVVSVGNLTVGGSGKTPFVAFLAELLLGLRRQPVILSRGYGRQTSDAVLLVSDGKGPLCRWEDSGDEPFLLAERLPGVPVVVSRNRFLAGRSIEDRLERVVHLLDDGFQHLRLVRDLDILLIDASDPFGSKRLLPAGRLREPLSGMARADHIVITRSHHLTDREPLLASIRRFNARAPIFFATHRLKDGVNLQSGEIAELQSLKGQSCVALAAIGRPEIFGVDLEQAGIEIRERLFFRDHHPFRQTDVTRVFDRLKESGADFIATTEKDAVRLRSLPCEKDRIYVFRLECWVEEKEEFRQSIRDWVERIGRNVLH